MISHPASSKTKHFRGKKQWKMGFFPTLMYYPSQSITLFIDHEYFSIARESQRLLLNNASYFPLKMLLSIYWMSSKTLDNRFSIFFRNAVFNSTLLIVTKRKQTTITKLLTRPCLKQLFNITYIMIISI